MLTFLDISGAIFGFLATYCFIRVNLLGWPLSLIAICLDIVLCLKSGIYGNMVLQFIYFFISIYGWYQWKLGKTQQSLGIRDITKIEAISLFAIAIGGFVAIFTLLKLTDSQIPYLDTSIVVISLLAQWLACKKIIQTWWLWLIADAILVGLYAYKNIPVHVVLFVIYTGMAVAGYFNWRKLKV